MRIREAEVGRTTALWTASREGGAAIGIRPLASPPSGLRLACGGAVLDLACGGRVAIGPGTAAEIRRLTEAASRLAVFEVDAIGNVRRSTRIEVTR